MDLGKHSGDLPAILAALLKQNRRDALRRGGNKDVAKRRRLPPSSASASASASARGNFRRQTAVAVEDNGADDAERPNVAASSSESSSADCPTAAPHPADELFPDDATAQEKRAVYRCLSIYTNGTPERDLTPHQWFFVEAVEYWNHVMLPNREEDELAVYERPTKSYGYYPAFSAAPAVVTSALAYHISAVYREKDQPIEWDGTSGMAAIWAKYHLHLAGLVRIINDDISRSATDKVPGMLDRIMRLTTLVDANAFLLLLHLRGGLEGATATREVSYQAIQLMVIHAVMAETTGPPTEPVRGLDHFSIDELRKLYIGRFPVNLCCPTELFLQIRIISQLRARVSQGGAATATATATGAEVVRAAARDIGAAIAAFSPAGWMRSEPDHWNFAPEKGELFASIALMYKDAVLLYAVMSLPAYAAGALFLLPGGGRRGDVARRKAACRARLLDTVRRTWSLVKGHYPPLFWSLVVAGVACGGGGGGGGGGHEAARKLVSDRMYYLGRLPEVSAAPLYILRKLKAFWASGCTGWDDCFDESIMGLAT